MHGLCSSSHATVTEALCDDYEGVDGMGHSLGGSATEAASRITHVGRVLSGDNRCKLGFEFRFEFEIEYVPWCSWHCCSRLYHLFRLKPPPPPAFLAF